MKKKNGFTIVELVLVIGLLVVITALFSINMIRVMNKNKEDEIKNVETQLVSAADAYVTMNPSTVQELYNGYGYIYITVGELRTFGLVNEDMKDPSTGEVIKDDRLIMVSIDIDGSLKFEFALDENVMEGYNLVLSPITINVDDSSSKICNRHNIKEEFGQGIVLYDKDGKKAPENLYEDLEIDIKTCSVDTKRVGNYSITYKYKDPALKIEREKERKVYVMSSNSDILSFKAELLDYSEDNKIAQGTSVASIKIIETKKKGETQEYVLTAKNNSNKLYTATGESKYEIVGFSTENVGSFTAEVKRATNSDGTIVRSSTIDYWVRETLYKVSVSHMLRNADGTGATRHSTRLMIVPYKSSVAISPIEIAGYTYSMTSQTTISSVRNDMALYLYYDPILLEIKLDPNGGTYDQSTSTKVITIKYGDTISFKNIYRDGYEFLGWYKSLAMGGYMRVSEEQKYYSSITLKALWDLESAVTKLLRNGVKLNEGSPDFSKIAEIDEGLWIMPDDFGNSYYFRGAVGNNYVKFGKWQSNTYFRYQNNISAYREFVSEEDKEIYCKDMTNGCFTELREDMIGKDMYWRIVRINGDGTIRLVYDGTIPHANGEETNVGSYEKGRRYDRAVLSHSYFNLSNNQYTYNLSYEDELQDSYIKSKLDYWYKANFKGTPYAKYIADSIFCYDGSNTKRYGTTTTHYTYGAKSRLIDSSSKSPTFMCNMSESSNKYTVSTSKGNGLLKYPIGLITADEISAAGGAYNVQNKSFYLYKNVPFWSMSPNYRVVGSSNPGSAITFNPYKSIDIERVRSKEAGLVPVINITQEAFIKMTGTGTMNDPYRLD